MNQINTAEVKGSRTVPSKSLANPDFKYVPACATDLRETFRRVREARAMQEAGI